MTAPVSKPNPFARALDIRKTLTTAPPVLDQVLPGLLAGTVAVCAGPGGMGKTTFLLQLCCALATGDSLCGGLFDEAVTSSKVGRTPSKVVFVCAEESAAIISHRLHAVARHLLREERQLSGPEREEILAMLERNLIVYPLQGVRDVTLLNAEHEPTEAFQQLRHACTDARLVVLDPLRQFHRGDENSSMSMNVMVQLLQNLASRTGAAVLVAHHVNRASTNDGTGDLAGAARGSTALPDGARWQLNLSRLPHQVLKQYGISADEESRYVRLNIAKANYLAPQATRVLQRMEGGVLVVVPLPERAGSVTRRGTTAPRSRGRTVSSVTEETEA